MEHGHPDARAYPIGMLLDETRLVNRRVNNGHVTTATLLQQAVAGVLSKRANKDFSKTMKSLTEE